MKVCRWTALCDLNTHIAENGGPRDKQSLAIQRSLAQAGKPHAWPTADPKSFQLVPNWGKEA